MPDHAHEHPGEEVAIHERTFEAKPAEVGLARRWVQEIFENAGWESYDAVVAVSEMATNVVLHTASAHFRLRIFSPQMRIECHDDSHEAPVLRDAQLDSVDGRGMQILRSFDPGYQTTLVNEGKILRLQPKELIPLGSVTRPTAGACVPGTS